MVGCSGIVWMCSYIKDIVEVVDMVVVVDMVELHGCAHGVWRRRLTTARVVDCG
jgi:hypothetical protein